MPLPSELVSIADRLIAGAIGRRNDTIRAELERREDEAVRSGRQDMAYYAQGQKDSCIKEMDERIDAVWSIYRRIISDASVPWTDEIRSDVLERINGLIDREVPGIEETARGVIVQHGHGFDLFLREASKAMRQRVTAELDLFGVRYRPIQAAIVLQLQAQRYTGPRQHWTEVQAALHSSPARFTNAAREAIHAVEGVAKIVAESPSDTLGDCIKNLRNRGQLNPATANTLNALWGLANAIQGVRHGASEEQTETQAEAEYVVNLSEAALKLLLNLDVPS